MSTNEKETEIPLSEESDCGTQVDLSSDSGKNETKKERKGWRKGYRGKIRNFHFQKRDKINSAKNIGG